jgi:hypothetical protein
LQFTLGNELDVVKVSFGARNTVVVVFQFYFYISAPLKLVLLGSDIKCCFRIGFKEGNEMVPTAFPFAATFILVV